MPHPVGMRDVMKIAAQPGANLPFRHHRRKGYGQKGKQGNPSRPDTEDNDDSADAGSFNTAPAAPFILAHAMFSYLFPALINYRRDKSPVLVKIAEEAQ